MLTSSSNDLQDSYWQCSSMAAATTNNEPSRSLLWPSGFGFGGESALLPFGGDIGGLSLTKGDDDMNMYIRLEEPQESIITKRRPMSLNRDVTAKKSHHNVKEKLRRMKLNDAYSSLKSLLPDAYKAKKKWSSPVVVAKVLEYIPDLQEEVEKLRERKDHMLLGIQKKQILTEDRLPLDSSLVPTVLTSEINEGEILAQICVQRDRQADVFSSLLANVEQEGIQIASASTLSISPQRVCFNLHLLVKGSFQPTHHVDILRDKIISWLSNLIPAGTA